MAALSTSSAAPAPVSPDERWPPLESSPDVFNQFMWSLGVPEDVAEFHDVYSLDADALEMVPQPVLAVVFCFPDPTQDARNPSQHVLVTGEKFHVKKGYILFLNYNRVLNPDSLHQPSQLPLHVSCMPSASAGDTKLSDDVEEHYICFVECDGTLYELDGMKPGPINHGLSSPKSLLQDAVDIIKASMHNIPNSANFNTPMANDSGGARRLPDLPGVVSAAADNQDM
uniref:Ubiquitin carboxyl-terminal hydrolase n=1 Tax=Oryza minuta TaxID=63629 RepID=G9C389_ORYMI|nr:putative ubiquitin carboxyl-terminal hydrolase family1 [Oryza minuta]